MTDKIEHRNQKMKAMFKKFEIFHFLRIIHFVLQIDVNLRFIQ